MTFWQFFVRVLPRRPSAALAALWWQITGRRVRARNRLRVAGANLPFAYRFWMKKAEGGEDDGVAGLVRRPTFTVVVMSDPSSTEQDVARTTQSIEAQAYPDWQLSNAGGNLDEALRGAYGDFVVPVRAGDRLSTNALLRYAQGLEAERHAKVVYGDQDRVDEGGSRTNPWFKPAWNPEMFLAQDYLSEAAAIRSDAAREAVAEERLNGDEPVYDLLLRVTGRASEAVIHVPHVTVHIPENRKSGDGEARLELVARHLAVAGARASAGPFGTVKVAWPLPSELPLVSIIIPTRDKVELLQPCVDSLLKLTTYPPIEVLIVDNDSIEERTHAYFSQVGEDERVRVLHSPGAYNYSAINNFAVREAAGSYLCFLNNDTEVIDGEWLTEMMRQAARPEVGAVGAKLLYADRSIQHAGVIVGIGDAAGHAHRNLPDTQPGYFGQPHVAQFVTAVTGACLVVEKRKFLDVGGFDEEQLAVAYNDVDLCLKLQQAGWRNVYTPNAVLIHHESKSRGKDHSPSQIDRYRRELKIFQERWETKTYKDPLLNPNLDRSSETFVIRL